MNYIPLIYRGILIGNALVEPLGLDPKIRWTVEIPDFIRRISKGRFDILVTTLKEPEYLQKCHPVTWFDTKKMIRLNRVTLRHELVGLLNQNYTLREKMKHEKPPLLKTLTDQQDILSKIIKLRASVQRVVVLTNNNCDCRPENIREVV